MLCEQRWAELTTTAIKIKIMIIDNKNSVHSTKMSGFEFNPIQIAPCTVCVLFWLVFAELCHCLKKMCFNQSQLTCCFLFSTNQNHLHVFPHFASAARFWVLIGSFHYLYGCDWPGTVIMLTWTVQFPSLYASLPFSTEKQKNGLFILFASIWITLEQCRLLFCFHKIWV